MWKSKKKSTDYEKNIIIIKIITIKNKKQKLK